MIIIHCFDTFLLVGNRIALTGLLLNFIFHEHLGKGGVFAEPVNFRLLTLTVDTSSWCTAAEPSSARAQPLDLQTVPLHRRQ